MVGLKEYFEERRYKAKYEIGDRVFGHYQKIPFIGSVGNDRYINDQRGPEITIHLDLPLMTKNGVHSIIIVKHKDIKPLKVYDDDFGLQRTTAKKRK
jgi:hypothetical protein